MSKEVKIEDLKKIMDENLKLAKENQEMLKKVRKYLLISRVWGLIKILIIFIPIILSIMYLPPLINNIFDNVKGGLELNKAAQTINALGPGVERLLNK